MSRSLFQELSEIEARIRAAAAISLFLDFDGTLAALEKDPAAVRLDPAVRETLARLAANENVAVAIVSGRAISDLLFRVGLEGVVYAGNHGLEICGRQLRFVEPVAAARSDDLGGLTGRLSAGLGGIAGVLVENKGLSATVHYRAAAGRDFAAIERTVRALASPVTEAFAVRCGKMAFEIIPRTNWNKGAAARWIEQRLDEQRLHRGNGLAICIGDDATDEDAFRALGDGITVKVGNPAATAARYYVADPPTVHEFLAWLEEHVPARTGIPQPRAQRVDGRSASDSDRRA